MKMGNQMHSSYMDENLAGLSMADVHGVVWSSVVKNQQEFLGISSKIFTTKNVL